MIRIGVARYVAALKFAYNPTITEEIKRLPAWGRGWNRDERQWEVAPPLMPLLVERLRALTGMALDAPPAEAYHPPVSVTLEALYVGRVKGEGELAAANVMTLSRQWMAALWGPAVLRWFGATPASANTPATLYELIGASPDASAAELTNAIKRQLRQWHPDVCREPDAAERTRQLLEARAILLDPVQRSRYDAGLEAARLAGMRRQSAGGEFRPPLRSGRITGTGYKVVDRWIIASIRSWDDLVDDRGRTAVVSWPAGAEDPVVVWV